VFGWEVKSAGLPHRTGDATEDEPRATRMTRKKNRIPSEKSGPSAVKQQWNPRNDGGDFFDSSALVKIVPRSAAEQRPPLQLAPIARPELFADALEVRLHRLPAHVQRLADCARSLSVAVQLKNLPLAR
jgi:hypothetical protein